MADGLLSSALGAIDRQKQAAKSSIGLLASNPQEWLTQATARYLPTKAEEQQYRAMQQAGGDITQTPYYQKLFDLAQFQSSIKGKTFYRGSTADEQMLRPSSGHHHGVLGISTTPDKKFAKMHGEYVKSYSAKPGEFVDFFDLVKMYDKAHGDDAFLKASEEKVTNFAKKKGYIGSYYNDPFGGEDYRFFDASSLIPIQKIKSKK